MKSSLATLMLLFIFFCWESAQPKGLKSENTQSKNGTTLASDQTFSIELSLAVSKEPNTLKASLSEQKSGNAAKTVVFHRITEPKERAFSLLIPKGWQTEGGIFRVNPSAQGGPAQSIAAKVDFIVKKDRGVP